MSLRELIGGVESHETTLTVFNADERVVEDLRERFADRNVTVAAERTPSGKPSAFLTVSEDGTVVDATSVTDLQAWLAGDSPADLGLETFQPVLDALDETMFTSWNTERMVAASREVEDRAWRVGSGRLHAGFQTVETLQGERTVYERLANSDLDVHVYAEPTSKPTPFEGLTLHLDRSEEIARSWFVVFDGDGDDDKKCALLAEERTPRSFFGFWTYDPATVDWILSHLDSTYGVVEQ